MNIMNNTVDFFSNSMAKYKSLSSNISDIPTYKGHTVSSEY